MLHITYVLAASQVGTPAEELVLYVLYVCADLPLLHYFEIKLWWTIRYLSSLKEMHQIHKFNSDWVHNSHCFQEFGTSVALSV